MNRRKPCRKPRPGKGPSRNASPFDLLSSQESPAGSGGCRRVAPQCATLGRPEAVADRCDRLFREARTGRVRVQLENKPEPVEMSLWEVVETDPRWRVLGDLWGRYGRADTP